MHFTFLRSNESRKCSSFTMVLTRKTVKSSRQKHKQNLKRASELSNISNGGKLNLLRRMYGRVYFRIIINNNFFPLLSPFFFAKGKTKSDINMFVWKRTVTVYGFSCIHASHPKPSSTSETYWILNNFYSENERLWKLLDCECNKMKTNVLCFGLCFSFFWKRNKSVHSFLGNNKVY